MGDEVIHVPDDCVEAVDKNELDAIRFLQGKPLLDRSPRPRPRVTFERRREINALALKISHELRANLKTQLERRAFYKMLDELSDLDDQ